MLALVVPAIALSLSTAAAKPLVPKAVVCPEGQEISADTRGHCCWPDQAWSKSKGVCVGAPSRCPPGTVRDGQTCTLTSPASPPSAAVPTVGCPVGQEISADTLGHCCWPDQAWSNAKGACVGVPSRCPAGSYREGDTCKLVAPVAVPTAIAPAAVAVCPSGQEVSTDTLGHCCWPGQAWSSARNTCVGIPGRCPAGTLPGGEACIGAPPSPQAFGPLIPVPVAVCPAGQERTADSQGHCCWPKQVWSSERGVCVGLPGQCPEGTRPSGETCKASSREGVRAPLPPQVKPATLSLSDHRSQVTFQPEGNRALTVLTEGADGQQECLSPCTLSLSPGKLRLVVAGARVDTELTIPPWSGTVKIEGPSRAQYIVAAVGGVILGPMLIAYGLTQPTKEEWLNISLVVMGPVLIVAGIINVFRAIFAKGSAEFVEAADLRGSADAEGTLLRLIAIGAGPMPGGGMAAQAALAF